MRPIAAGGRHSGGTVTIEIRPDPSSYQGSNRHGVSSGDYNAWNGSVVFVH